MLKKRRSVGGMKSQKLKPYFEDDVWKADCPEDCGHVMVYDPELQCVEIHDCEERAYSFRVDNDLFPKRSIKRGDWIE